MQTLTLLQGVVNTFVFFFARVIGNVIDRIILKNEDGRGFAYYMIVFILEILLGIIASVIVMAFSRHREFKADKGGAELTSNEDMARALHLISGIGGELPQKMASFGIFGVPKGSFRKLFSTHPPMQDRINKLMS